MFSFVIRYFGFLKNIPLLPHLFDSLLKLFVFLTNAELLDSFDEIEADVLSWDGTSTSMHKYGGLQFNYNGKEIGHLHGNGLLDVLYSREIKRQLMEKGQIKPHHVFENSGWISFHILSYNDKDYAKELLEMAYKRSFKSVV